MWPQLSFNFFFAPQLFFSNNQGKERTDGKIMNVRGAKIAFYIDPYIGRGLRNLKGNGTADGTLACPGIPFQESYYK